jgi:hypothetical protein
MLAQPGCSIVKVEGSKELGMGFLVDAVHVVTCAHVISLSEASSNLYIEPQEPINVTFIFEDNRPQYNAHVVAWAPPKNEPCPEILDIAVLKIDGNKPREACLAQLIDREGRGNQFKTYGYPERYKGASPTWAYGEICDRLETGILQIEHSKDKGIFVQGGFSGAPVWDETREGVVGMVVSAESRDGIAHVIPSDELVKWCPKTVYRVFSGAQAIAGSRLFDPNATEGEVRGLEKRSEYSGGEHGSSTQVWTFRLERVDNEGTRLRPIPVQMSARGFNGVISEGDFVEVSGTFTDGVLTARTVYNVTTASTVAAKRVPRAAVAAGIIFLVVIIAGFLFVSGAFSSMFGHSGVFDGMVPFGPESPTSSQSPTTISPAFDISGRYVGELSTVGGFSPGSGTKFSEIYATLTNLNANGRPMEPHDIKLKTSNGNVYSLDVRSGFAPNAMTTLTTSQPGEKLAGNLIFNIPQDAVPQSLVYQNMWGNTATCNV